MKLDLKTYNVIAAVLVFIGLPVLFYALGDFPRRSVLKEAISVLTLLTFSLMLGQFYLARSNMGVIQLYDLRNVQRAHKVIAYFVLTAVLLHPFLIVVPRFFEAGVDPISALVTMLTSFDNLGVVLGMIGWVVMLVLAMTSIFRMSLIKRYAIKYRNWRMFHGYLSVVLVTVVLIHAIKLGRHTNVPMTGLMIALAIGGIALLFKLYFGPAPKPAEAKS